MTLAMPDSVTVPDLPGGYDAYLGYADGTWPTAAALHAKFPAADLLILTVTGQTLQADGCDVETGDLTPEGGARWAVSKRAAYPGFRPVMYASVGVMGAQLLPALAAKGVARPDVRLLSAHYGAGPHICGPRSCGELGTGADGTQWTDAYMVPGGARVDMSMLADGFFGTVPPLTGTEKIVAELGIVRQGDTGDAARTVQGLCVARRTTGLAVDGVYGPYTVSAVKFLQSAARVPADGVVGPVTWRVLLGIA